MCLERKRTFKNSVAPIYGGTRGILSWSAAATGQRRGDAVRASAAHLRLLAHLNRAIRKVVRIFEADVF